MKTNSVFEVWCNDDSMPSMYYWKRILRQIETDKGNRIYLSVIRLQRFRFKSSILLQCCANVRIAWSATDWHPLSESCFKNPPHLLAMFSTTTPYSPLKKMWEHCLPHSYYSSTSTSVWKLNRSIYCQLLPSNARMFQYLDTWAQRHNDTISKKENTLM